MIFLGGQPVATSEGVYFQKRDGDRMIKFLVTRAALSHLAGAHLEIRQLEFEYQRHHSVIAEAASRFFGARNRNKVFPIGPEDVKCLQSGVAG